MKMKMKINNENENENEGENEGENDEKNRGPYNKKFNIKKFEKELRLINNNKSKNIKKQNNPSFGNRQRDKPSFPNKQQNKPSFGNRQRDKPSFPNKQQNKPSFGNRQIDKPSFPNKQQNKYSFGNRQRDKPSFPNKQKNKYSFGNRQRDKPSFPNKLQNKPSFGNRQRDKPSFPNKQQNKQEIINIKPDNLCEDESKDCKLTKKQMCRKIAYHFVVRNNIIAAILSTIPFENKEGDYNGSFVYKRLTNLISGKFCLPPYWSEINNKEDNQRIESILKFINIMNEKDCKEKGGYYLTLSKEKIGELLEDKILGTKYIQYTQKINTGYIQSLNELNSILDLLFNSHDLSTNNLNIIGKKVKYIIDELYIKTQFNYLVSVLLLLDFDFKDTRKQIEKKTVRLKRIMNEDFTV